jgi:hypothetical protein
MGRLRVADNPGGRSQTVKDRTLQLPARPARSHILELGSRGPNREQIVAGHDVWQMTDPRQVEGIRVVANVHDDVAVGADSKRLPELARKQQQLVCVTNPLRKRSN